MSFEGFHHATPLEDRFFARIGDTDVTPIEVWRQLAAKENRARLDRDGPGANLFHGVTSPKKGTICEKTMKVLRATEDGMDTGQIARAVGIEVKECSGVMQRLQTFGLVEKAGRRTVLRPCGTSRINTWRVTSAGQAYRSAR